MLKHSFGAFCLLFEACRCLRRLTCASQRKRSRAQVPRSPVTSMEHCKKSGRQKLAVDRSLTSQIIPMTAIKHRKKDVFNLPERGKWSKCKSEVMCTGRMPRLYRAHWKADGRKVYKVAGYQQGASVRTSLRWLLPVPNANPDLLFTVLPVFAMLSVQGTMRREAKASSRITGKWNIDGHTYGITISLPSGVPMFRASGVYLCYTKREDLEGFPAMGLLECNQVYCKLTMPNSDNTYAIIFGALESEIVLGTIFKGSCTWDELYSTNPPPPRSSLQAALSNRDEGDLPNPAL
ncbi:hypothetical protein CERSUDRAFT_77479 [Gelatoporia subvermispora B]|uniref:Uncharacterized protein n=1 Tax=Ceriporiopsis subvermispora (strain B) TaxID=914234 RepID=M2R0V8_CERS8|nr:hypothetical protein CERSUDRAFT_77479 [Gelatoporia subvermispora B]